MGNTKLEGFHTDLRIQNIFRFLIIILTLVEVALKWSVDISSFSSILLVLKYYN